MNSKFTYVICSKDSVALLLFTADKPAYVAMACLCTPLNPPPGVCTGALEDCILLAYIIIVDFHLLDGNKKITDEYELYQNSNGYSCPYDCIGAIRSCSGCH